MDKLSSKISTTRLACSTSVFDSGHLQEQVGLQPEQTAGHSVLAKEAIANLGHGDAVLITWAAAKEHHCTKVSFLTRRLPKQVSHKWPCDQ